MATTIQYWGTVNYQEKPLTGRLVLWTRGQKQDVPDDIATLLLAAGAGFTRDLDNSGEVAVYAQDSSGNVTGLVGPDGGIACGPKGTTVYNPLGLKRWRRAFADSETVTPTIWCVGDSITFGTGCDNTVAEPTDAVADSAAWAGRLKTLFGRYFGATSVSGYVNSHYANFVLTGTGTITKIAGLGGYNVLLSPNAAAGTNNAKFVIPVACTSVDVISYENNGGGGDAATTAPFRISVNGTGTYATDLAGSTLVSNSGGTKQYKVTTITGTFSASTPVYIYQTDATSNAIIAGVRYSTSPGVAVCRVGNSGWTLGDILGNSGASGNNNQSASAQARLSASFSTAGHLYVIAFGRNEWVLQATQGSTPSVFAANLATVLANIPATASVLLIGEPDDPMNVSNPSNYGAYKYSDYKNVLKGFAVDGSNIAYFDLASYWSNFTNANAAGLMAVNSVHPSRSGHSDMAKVIYQLLVNGIDHE